MVQTKAQKEWYQRNRERKLAESKERYIKEKDKVLSRQHQRLQSVKANPELYAKFREGNNIRGRSRYTLNREKEAARKRKRYYEIKKENPPLYLNMKKLQCERSKSNYRLNKANYFYEHSLSHKYGMTEKQYRDLLLKQEYKCALCQNTFDLSKRKQINVDHNHITGKVREILCNRCNLILGIAKENIDYLNKCINYLEKHNDYSSN